jgi:hypothetical protein
MRTFNQMILALGGGAGPWQIGDDPPLTVNLNGGVPRSLVAVLNQGVHITIFEDSWDNQAGITDLGGEIVPVGPHCLHVTAGKERWFRQYKDGDWQWVTDYGTPTQRYLKAFEAMMNTLGRYL